MTMHAHDIIMLHVENRIHCIDLLLLITVDCFFSHC